MSSNPKRKLTDLLSPYAFSSTRGSIDSHSSSEQPASAEAATSQDVDALSAHDPSLSSHPQDPHLPNDPLTNQIGSVILAGDAAYLAPSTSHTGVQARVSRAPTGTSIAATHDPRIRLISSHAPNAAQGHMANEEFDQYNAVYTGAFILLGARSKLLIRRLGRTGRAE